MYCNDFLPSCTSGNQVMETAAFPVVEIHFRHSFYFAIPKISYNTVRSPKCFVTALNLPSWWFSKKKEEVPTLLNDYLRWLFFPPSFSKLSFLLNYSENYSLKTFHMPSLWSVLLSGVCISRAVQLQASSGLGIHANSEENAIYATTSKVFK